MNSLTTDLAQFVADLSLRQVPAQGRDIARMGIADCFGVMVAGARDTTVTLVDRAFSDLGNDEAASLIPSGQQRPIDTAALVNGVAAHVLDYDDVTLDGHPSAVLVPAILAQGEASQSSGAEMLAAYIAGYEVWAELLVREPTPLHRKGWHPTAMRGAIGAAAACAKLRRLDANATATAMAIAASMASGVIANFGTMTKSFQVGRAAQSGVIAARLAQAGLTASCDALEHPSGFLAALSPEDEAELDQPFVAEQKEWHIVRQGLNIKRYPTCYGTHRSIDGALDLIERYDLSASDVEKKFTSRRARRSSRCSATAARKPVCRPSLACSSPWPRRSLHEKSNSRNSPTNSCNVRTYRRSSPAFQSKRQPLQWKIPHLLPPTPFK